jgi:hypothetical protein
LEEFRIKFENVKTVHNIIIKKFIFMEISFKNSESYHLFQKGIKKFKKIIDTYDNEDEFDAEKNVEQNV